MRSPSFATSLLISPKPTNREIRAASMTARRGEQIASGSPPN
jgi:hypothetical protein